MHKINDSARVDNELNFPFSAIRIGTFTVGKKGVSGFGRKYIGRKDDRLMPELWRCEFWLALCIVQ